MEISNRRIFLKTAAAATAASYGRILGANDRIRIGAIGTGGRCQGLLAVLNQLPDNEVVAVCDVYEPHRDEARAKYGTNASDFVDYREVLDRADIDAVFVGTPDHWHVPITIAAVRAGKDVYCEKPVTHTLAEGQPLIDAVREMKRVVQTGMQQRSWAHFAQAKDIVRSGQLGQITMIRTHWYQRHAISRGANLDWTKLDWKRFLGNAPDREPNQDQYSNWRWYWDFGSGAMTDLFLHWVDVAHWMMDADSPTSATATGIKAILTERQTADTMNATLVYPNTLVTFECALLGYLEGGGLTIRGTKSMMRLGRGGFKVYNELPTYSENLEPPNPAMDVKSEHDGVIDHVKNFLDCARSRATPNASVEIGVAAARAGHIANLALRGNGVWRAA
jgi:predicted dehydrogenase